MAVNLPFLPLILSSLLAYSVSTAASVSGNIGYFWHLTDFHFDSNFTTNPDNVRNSSEFYDGTYDYDTCWEEGGGAFGDFSCDSPWRLVDSALRFVAAHSAAELVAQGADRPFVLWTGDDTSHAGNEYFDLDVVLSTVESLTSAISELGLDVYPAMGNHDAHPKNQFPDDPDSELYARTADLWSGWLGGKGDAEQQFRENGGFYSVSSAVTGFPFHLVCLNTNVYYKSNEEVDDDEDDPLEQFAWMEDLLDGYRASGTKAVVFAHISPGKFERYYQPEEEGGGFGFHWFREEYNERYLEIMDEYSDVVSGQFYGHHHTDALKSLRSTWAALAPAVTPWRSTLAPETGANNPAVRLVEYDKTTGEILDYTQFWLNLAEANAENFGTWRKLYSLKEYYGLDDFSVDSINALIEEVGTEESTFAKYYHANTVAYEEFSNDTCDGTCRRFHYCAAARQDYRQFDACILGEEISDDDGGNDTGGVSGLGSGHRSAVAVLPVALALDAVQRRCSGSFFGFP